jgi:hypothetical protein
MAGSSAFRFNTAFLALALAGCEVPPEIARRIPPELKRALGLEAGATSSGPRTALPVEDRPAEGARAKAELLREVMAVTFMKEPSNRAEFKSYLSVLAQGGSLEGIYNGFTHASGYRELEMSNQGAAPTAIKVFSEELAELQAELAVPSEITAETAKPLAPPVWPDGSETPPPKTPVAKPKVLTPEAYAKLFVGSSIYTLKRVIGDEALKVTASKMNFPDTLATWYSKWVVRLAGRGVDFGLPLRSKPDEAFHKSWALNANRDQLNWEVLNRLHRLLNDANRRTR